MAASNSSTIDSTLQESRLHFCPICSKQFNRRDLMHRHRRRCERSIGKVKQTKKRACESCMESKVKCDHEKPACGRCLIRSIQCEYRLDPQPAIRQPVTLPLESDNTIPLSQQCNALQNGNINDLFIDDNFLDLLSNTVPDTGFMFDSANHDASHSHADLMPSQDTSQLWATHDANQQNGHVWEGSLVPNGSNSHIEKPFPANHTPMDQMWTSNPIQTNCFFADDLQFSNTTSSTPENLLAGQPSAENLGRIQVSPQASSAHSPTGILTQSSHNSISSAVGPNSRVDDHDSTESSPQYSQRSTHSGGQGPFTSLSEPLPIDCRSKSVNKHSDSLSEGARIALMYHNRLPAGLISVEQARKMISEYPLRMLVDTFQSPFIHPRLNRESPRGMPEPIAVALACVGMKMHSERPGLPFVCDIFRDQREKLIRELPSMTKNYEEVSAVLHAMCIYQIEGLLSDKRYDSKLSTAVLHHEYLVRVTRRLISHLEARSSVEHPSYSILTSPTPSNLSWKTWTVHESLKRTLYLLMIIHQLLGATKVLDPAYFEPLIPEMTLDKLRLPCGARLWSASNEKEWQDARNMENGREDGEEFTLGHVKRKIVPKAGADGENTAMSDAGSRNGDNSIEPAMFEKFPELTKLIISVAGINLTEV